MKNFIRYLPVVLALLFFGYFEIQACQAAQPPGYSRQANFTDWTQNYPDRPQQGGDLDNEYNAIKRTLDAILTNIALIQRDDGRLANSSVGLDQLSAEISVGINPVGNWQTATVYSVNDAVWQGSILYRCKTSHTSGAFATDLAAGYWESILDLSVYLNSAAASASAASTSATNASASATAAAASAAQLSGTSGTSNSISIGSKTFTTQAGKYFTPPAYVLISSGADPVNNNMFGTVTGYTGTTLNVTISAVTGSGSHTDWTIVIAGARGAQGAQGAAGAGTGDMLAANNLSDLSNKTAARVNLGVEIGNNVQAFDADLSAIAGLTTAADTIPYFTGSHTASLVTFTSAARGFIAASSVSAQRTTLGLGTASTLNVGGSANNIVQLDGSAKLPAYDGSQLTNLNTSSSWKFISSQTAAASSTLVFTGMGSQCSAYKFIFSGLRPNVNGGGFGARFSYDNGSSFAAGGSDYAWSENAITIENPPTSLTAGRSTNYLGIGGASSNSTRWLNSGELIIYDPASTLAHVTQSEFTDFNTSSKVEHITVYGIQGQSTSPISAMQFFYTGATISTGTIYEYCISSS